MPYLPIVFWGVARSGASQGWGNLSNRARAAAEPQSVQGLVDHLLIVSASRIAIQDAWCAFGIGLFSYNRPRSSPSFAKTPTLRQSSGYENWCPVSSYNWERAITSPNYPQQPFSTALSPTAAFFPLHDYPTIEPSRYFRFCHEVAAHAHLIALTYLHVTGEPSREQGALGRMTSNNHAGGQYTLFHPLSSLAASRQPPTPTASPTAPSSF